MTCLPRRGFGGTKLPVSVLGLALSAVALSAGSAPGQELSGVALGPDGEPLTHVTVVLHRVGADGAGFVATDTTSPAGGFQFALEAGEPAVYFAALRYEDRLYMGPAVEATGEPLTGYLIRVEPGSEAGAVASALGNQLGPARPNPATAQPATGPSDTGAFVLVALLALGAVGAFLMAAPRYRERRTRDALVELATAENALAGSASAGDRPRTEARRDRLRKQLAPRA